MKLKYISVFLGLFFLSNIYAYNYNVDFNSPHYYEEQIDIGISDLNNTEINIININIFSSYETYLNYDYSIEEIKEIPIIFNNQVSPNLKIVYAFFDINENIIEEEEFDLNLMDNLEIGDFYLCYSEDCNPNDIPRNYDFWIDEDIYLSSDNINQDKFNYNVIIETNNQILLADQNTQLPYLIPNNIIAGQERYKLTIDIIDKTNLKKYTKEIRFALSEITENENREIFTQIIESEDTEADSENQIVGNIVEPESDSEKTEDTEIDTANSKSKNYWIWIVVAIITIIVFMVFSKPNKNRREGRKK